jgi:hypothetical protein
MTKAVPFWTATGVVTLLACAQCIVPIAVSAGQNGSEVPQTAGDSTQARPHFLVRLNQEMNTGRDKVSQSFEVTTLEPIETSNGYVIRPGARIVGHISRVEPAGLMGRARLWLTFDDIDTRRGTLPIVAEVSGVPDEHSVRTGPSKEGEIEGRSEKIEQVTEATAAGAAKGSASGVTSHNAKAAAIGAANGGLAAFLASSGLGQEIELPKGTKLELALDRPLYSSR